MAKRIKYSVTDYNSGGFFITGGNMTDNYFKNKADATAVCAALNMMERIKTRTFRNKLDTLIWAARAMDEALNDGTVECY
jgi:hypothetical protein